MTFRVLQGAATLFQSTAITGSGGNAILTPPSGSLPVGYFTVVAPTLGSDGQVSASDTALDVDTSVVAFQPSVTADLGIAAVVKDVGSIAWAGRKVTVTVSRGGGTLYTINGTTDSNGKVDVDALGGVPSGRVTVRADLYDAPGTSIRQTVSTEQVRAGLTVTPSAPFLEAKTGTTYPAFSVTVADSRGPGGRGSRHLQPTNGHAGRGVHERVEQRTPHQSGDGDDERPGCGRGSDDGRQVRGRVVLPDGDHGRCHHAAGHGPDGRAVRDR